MNYFSAISDKIKAAVSSYDVAVLSSSTVPISGDWGTYHVFDGGRKFIGGQNRGRTPFVNIWRESSTYTNGVISDDDAGGMVDSVWNIEVVVGNTSRQDENNNEENAYLIMQKIIRKIRENSDMSIGSESIGNLENHPFGSSIITQVTIHNRHSNSLK